MNELVVGIRIETRALKQSVSAALAARRRRYRGTESFALLLLEPDFPEWPIALIEDTVLKPVDKVLGLLLMTHARKCDGVTTLPTHVELARMANVLTRQAVSRSLLILRCRRWLTVCNTSWRKGGLQVSSAFALHASPLPVADTIFLDPHYRAAIEKLAGHDQGRVRNAAIDVLGQLPDACSSRLRMQ